MKNIEDRDKDLSKVYRATQRAKGWPRNPDYEIRSGGGSIVNASEISPEVLENADEAVANFLNDLTKKGRAMSNVTRRRGEAVYADPTDLTKAELEFMPDYPDSNKVGLCMIASDSGYQSVVFGVDGEENVRALLYEMAVQSKLIKDGEILFFSGREDDGEEHV